MAGLLGAAWPSAAPAATVVAAGRRTALASPGSSSGCSRRRCLQVQATAREQDAVLSQGGRTVLPDAPPLQPQAAPRGPPPAEQPQLSGLSYVKGPTGTPLLEETLGQCLARTVAAYPDHDAVVSLHQGLRWTYREFAGQVEGAALGLLALGVQKGDRVGIWAPNCGEWTVLQFAAARVGAILVNINPAYRAAELQYSLDLAGVAVLVLAPGLRGSSDFVAMLDTVRGQLPALRHAVVLGAAVPPPGYVSWGGLLAGGAADPGLRAALAEREAGLAPADRINIQFTSGTTGHPKAATLSHRSILNNGYFIAQTCRYTAADRVCIPVPLYHCFGEVIGNMACVTSGAAMVYPAESFSAQAALEAVQAERCTSLYGVPTMFIAALDLPGFGAYRLDSLRTGVMAGAPCPVEVMKRVRADMHMEEVTICMGMTETSPVSFQSHVDDPVEKRVSTVGRIHPHLEARVVDPASGKTVPVGTVGELHVRGYSVMLGYWGDDAATAAAIDQDGWIRTGDLALLDAQGYCSVSGRMRDVVIRGGENIYPREVEEFLHGHPSVAEVQAFGVPSRLYGEELAAWVKLRPGVEGVGRAELRAWCSGKIARFKVPRYWKLVDAFPTTISGKPQKYKMREAMVAELGLGAEGGK